MSAACKTLQDKPQATPVIGFGFARPPTAGSASTVALNRIVSAYLEFAEVQALNRKPMTMRAWIAKLDDFLKLSDHELLSHAGKIRSSAMAEALFWQVLEHLQQEKTELRKQLEQYR